MIVLSAASDVVGGYQDSLSEAKSVAKSEAKAESRPFSLVMSGEQKTIRKTVVVNRSSEKERTGERKNHVSAFRHKTR